MKQLELFPEEPAFKIGDRVSCQLEHWTQAEIGIILPIATLDPFLLELYEKDHLPVDMEELAGIWAIPIECMKHTELQ